MPVWFALRYPKKQRSNATPGFALDLMSVSLVVLGINSFIFHATLRHTTQYCDEISMFLLGSALIQGVFTINQSPRVRNIMTAAILGIMTVLSAIYIQTGNILHHVWSFNAMMGLVGLRTMFLIFTGGRPREEKARLLGLFGKAVAVLVVAYTLWQIDLEKCIELRWIREALGLPWAWLLELHGWWHVLTALGASRYIRLIRELSD